VSKVLDHSEQTPTAQVQVLPAEVFDNHHEPMFVLRFDEGKDIGSLLKAKELTVKVFPCCEDQSAFEPQDELAKNVRCAIEPITGAIRQRYLEAQKSIRQKRKLRKEQRKHYQQSKTQNEGNQTQNEGNPVLLKKRAVRPSLDDVLRLSRGQSTRSRTGSRQVPHRLNADETKRFQLARDHGFLVVRGSGYRVERKGSPLSNLHRQLCDAESRVALRIEQRNASTDICVDFSTLRQSPEAIQALQDRYDDYVRDFVLDHGMFESMIEIKPIDVHANMSGSGGCNERAGDDSSYLEQPIWQMSPVGFVVEMETRTDARLVAQALSSLSNDGGNEDVKPKEGKGARHEVANERLFWRSVWASDNSEDNDESSDGDVSV